MKFKLARLSICECGFTVLNESIPLGTVYDTGPLVIKSNATLICGGCGSQIEGDWIYFMARGDSHEGFLPLAAFEPVTETEAAT